MSTLSQTTFGSTTDVVPARTIRALMDLNIARTWDDDDETGMGGGTSEGYDLGAVSKKGRLSGLIGKIPEWIVEGVVVNDTDPMTVFSESGIDWTACGNRRAKAVEKLLELTDTLHEQDGSWFISEPKTGVPVSRTIDLTDLQVKVVRLESRPTEFDLSVLMADHVTAKKKPGPYGNYRMFRDAIKRIAEREGISECKVPEAALIRFRPEWTKSTCQIQMKLNKMPKRFRTAHELALKDSAHNVPEAEAEGLYLTNDRVHDLYTLHLRSAEERDALYELFESGEKPVQAVRSRTRKDITDAMEAEVESTTIREGMRNCAGDSGSLERIDDVLVDMERFAKSGDAEGWAGCMDRFKNQLIAAEEAQSAFLKMVGSNGN